MDADTTVAASQESESQEPDTTLEDYEFQEEAEEGEVAAEPGAAEPEAPEPVQLTSEQIMAQAEERAFQRMASWSGRRDKELLDTIGGLIDQKFQRTQRIEPTEPASILDDPDGWAERKIRELAPKVMYEENNRATTAQNNYNSALIQNAGRMMDNDPLFTDKEFGGQVIQEIQAQFGSINHRLPPDVNAQLLINSAVANIYRKNAGGKKNALSGNTGVKTGVGGVSPSGKPTTPARAPKLSPDAQRLAQRWNYKAEDLERVFAEH